MALALVLVPLAFAVLALAVPSNRFRPWIVLAGGAAHFAVVLAALRMPHVSALGGWLLFGPVARLALAFVAVLGFACCVYARGYLALHPARNSRVFCGCLLAFLGLLTLAIEAQHLGLMWLAIESATLASAPMLFFEGSPRALEATWKYMLIGSVGIALALLGSFFLAYSALRGGLAPSLLLDDMVKDAPRLSRPWLRSAFILLFVGYGTKMGLAPMHTWKPDTYGEAPGLVGALLASGLTTGAFVAILRIYVVCHAAGDPSFARTLMLVTGLLSMGVAGAFMARQRDFKRLLAYSSVEQMGVLVLGVGVGGGAVFGAMLHLMNNGLAKGALFLAAGNVHRAYRSKSTDEVRGVMRRLPASGALLLAGFFALAGSPPFGAFFSVTAILEAAISRGHPIVAALFLVMLVVVFIGMGAAVLGMVQGRPPEENAEAAGPGDRFATVAPAVALLAGVLLLGVYLPPSVETLVRDAAAFVEVAR